MSRAFVNEDNAAAQADQPAVYTGVLSRVAVGGYDPVAYFTDGRPVALTTAPTPAGAS